MAKEKGAAPSRRLPSRSARASLEPESSNDQQEVSPDAAATPTSPRDDLAGATTNNNPGAGGQAETQDSSCRILEGRHNGDSNEPSSNGGVGGAATAAGSAYPSRSGTQQEGEAVASSALTSTPASSRGRGRPRKKTLEIKVDTVEMQDAKPAGAEASPRPAAAAAAAAATPATPATPKAPDSLAGQASGDGAEIGAEAGFSNHGEEDNDGGNESDEWSEDDEVHRLPPEVKAQFGEVRGELHMVMLMLRTVVGMLFARIVWVLTFLLQQLY